MMALNKLHDLLDGDSLLTETKFKKLKGHHGDPQPMHCVELLDSKLVGSTYTVKLKIPVVTRKYLGDGKEGDFFTPVRIIDQIFQALAIMPDKERFVELTSE